MMHYYNSGFGLFHGLGFIFPLITLAIFLYVIYWVVNSGRLSDEKPKDILNKRLAKGEITKKEYHDLLKEIEK